MLHANNVGASAVPPCSSSFSPVLPPRLLPLVSLKQTPRHRAGASTQESAEPGPATERFFRSGSEGEARQELFSNISSVYDDLNDELSFGLHRVWKRMTVKWTGAAKGDHVLDVCCGSGDLALLLADAVGAQGRVTGLDFSAAMLEDAASREAMARRQRIAAVNAMPKIDWIQGDAMKLPFEDGVFDAATMGYGLRNVSSIPQALGELRRVLKPGSRAAVLDFNNSPNYVVDAAQSWFLENLVVPRAEAKGVGDEYRYLRPSIQRFPRGREQETLAIEAGFARARHYEIGFGTMGVLVCTA
jgi:demethylphylloquinol methyltransferase